MNAKIQCHPQAVQPTNWFRSIALVKCKLMIYYCIHNKSSYRFGRTIRAFVICHPIGIYQLIFFLALPLLYPCQNAIMLAEKFLISLCLLFQYSKLQNALHFCSKNCKMFHFFTPPYPIFMKFSKSNILKIAL